MNIKYINKNKQLQDLISVLKQSKEIAVDLEFDKNRFRYGFNLCLVQIFHQDTCYLIDPLSDQLDINILFPIFESNDIQKVVFTFGEDLRLLHSLGCFPKNIYDINIATSLLNYPPGSLSSKIKEFLQVETGSSAQNSNWFIRPLSEKQKSYAAEDVNYLLALKKVISEKAEKQNIASWIQEENAYFDHVSYADATHITYIKEKDKKGLTEAEWYIFKKLMEFRETVAEKYNKPGYQTIDKDFLKEVAKNTIQININGHEKGLYRSINTPKFKTKLKKLKADYEKEAEALNLSKTTKANYLNSKEYSTIRKERNRVENIKNQYFKPIQKKIAIHQGENVASFMLSNRLILELIAGNTENLRNYKKELILYYADMLDIEIEPYLSNSSL